MKKITKYKIVTEEISEKDFKKLICEARISPNGDEIDAYHRSGNQGYIRRLFSIPNPKWNMDEDELLEYVRERIPKHINLIDVT